MSKKYRLKNVIDKLEAIYCGPLYYTVPLWYAIFSWKIFHPKNRSPNQVLTNTRTCNAAARLRSGLWRSRAALEGFG